jgi:hypothetical protein
MLPGNDGPPAPPRLEEKAFSVESFQADGGVDSQIYRDITACRDQLRSHLEIFRKGRTEDEQGCFKLQNNITCQEYTACL